MVEAHRGKLLTGNWPQAFCLGLLLIFAPVPLYAQSNCNDPERERNFLKQFRDLNFKIAEKQKRLKQKLYDPEATEGQLKGLAKELSHWRMKREQLAIDYILHQRRVDCPPPNTLIDDR